MCGDDNTATTTTTTTTDVSVPYRPRERRRTDGFGFFMFFFSNFFFSPGRFSRVRPPSTATGAAGTPRVLVTTTTRQQSVRIVRDDVCVPRARTWSGRRDDDWHDGRGGDGRDGTHALARLCCDGRVQVSVSSPRTPFRRDARFAYDAGGRYVRL